MPFWHKGEPFHKIKIGICNIQPVAFMTYLGDTVNNLCEELDLLEKRIPRVCEGYRGLRYRSYLVNSTITGADRRLTALHLRQCIFGLL